MHSPGCVRCVRDMPTCTVHSMQAPVHKSLPKPASFVRTVIMKAAGARTSPVGRSGCGKCTSSYRRPLRSKMLTFLCDGQAELDSAQERQSGNAGRSVEMERGTTLGPQAARKLPLGLHSNSTRPSPSRSWLTENRFFILLLTPPSCSQSSASTASLHNFASQEKLDQIA